MPWYRKMQIVVMSVAIIAVSRLGWEFFVNDVENLTVVKVCGYTALTALYVNMILAIYRFVKEWRHKK